jgi:hypothetical protein
MRIEKYIKEDWFTADWNYRITKGFWFWTFYYSEKLGWTRKYWSPYKSYEDAEKQLNKLK